MSNGQPPSGALEAQIHALAVDRVKNRSYYHVQDLCCFAKEVLALAQPAEGGVVERAVQESWINTIRRASRSIGMTRDDSIVLCHIADHMERTTPPASLDQAQQPSTQAWANETGMRQIECPSCGDLAVAYDPQQPSPATPADMAVYQSIADGYTKAQQLSGEVVASPWVVSSKEQA